MDDKPRPCPNCEKGMMHIYWLQYDNPPNGKPMTLQAVKWGCSYCAHSEVWTVAKPESEPYILCNKHLRTWRAYDETQG